MDFSMRTPNLPTYNSDFRGGVLVIAATRLCCSNSEGQVATPRCARARPPIRIAVAKERAEACLAELVVLNFPQCEKQKASGGGRRAADHLMTLIRANNTTAAVLGGITCEAAVPILRHERGASGKIGAHPGVNGTLDSLGHCAHDHPPRPPVSEETEAQRPTEESAPTSLPRTVLFFSTNVDDGSQDARTPPLLFAMVEFVMVSEPLLLTPPHWFPSMTQASRFATPFAEMYAPEEATPSLRRRKARRRARAFAAPDL
jgi:hypothetical protein